MYIYIYIYGIRQQGGDGEQHLNNEHTNNNTNDANNYNIVISIY